MASVITAKITGGRQLVTELRKLSNGLSTPKVRRAAMRPVADRAFAIAQSLVRRRTGALAKSMVVVEEEGSLIIGHVGGPARRAHLIEFGTNRAPAFPYMRPAAKAATTSAEQLGARVWSEAADRITRGFTILKRSRN